MALSSGRTRALVGGTFALGLVAVGLQIAFVRTMDGSWMWLSLLADLAFGAAWLTSAGICASGLRSRRRDSVMLGAVALLAAATRFLAGDVGLFLRDRDSERLRPALERGVARLDATPDSLLNSLDPARVVPEHPQQFYAVRAIRPAPGRLSVWFFYGGLGLPPRHAAWLYDSDSTVTGAGCMPAFGIAAASFGRIGSTRATS